MLLGLRTVTQRNNFNIVNNTKRNMKYEKNTKVCDNKLNNTRNSPICHVKDA